MKFKITRTLKKGYTQGESHFSIGYDLYCLVKEEPQPETYRWLGGSFSSREEVLEFAKTFSSVYQQEELEI